MGTSRDGSDQTNVGPVGAVDRAARRPFAWPPVAVVLAVQAALLLAMAPHYGPHRDELYFVSAGERLAWGYPDQPSFTPLLARLSTEIASHSLVVLRLWSILAVAGLVLLAVQYARLLGEDAPEPHTTSECDAISVDRRASSGVNDGWSG